MKRLLFAILAIVLAGCGKESGVIRIEGGLVRGVPSSSPGVTVFRGIPYAAPPVGKLRWKAPQPVVPWDGVMVCDKFGPIAPQPGNKPGTFYGDEFYWQGTPEESEDCLYLNVWVPDEAVGHPETALPVAMWIHGGAYLNGYGYEVTMDGEAWAKRGVILVTINYRLGVLGFLTHPELSALNDGTSGNYGTLDQIAALKWVHDNIAAFGGDPARITVFGQSAGAKSVMTLVQSPLSRGLIKGAIIQSGGGLGPVVRDDSEAALDSLGKAIMDNAGYPDLAAMNAAPANEIYRATVKYQDDGKGWVLLRPHTDGKVIQATFEEEVLAGNIANIPYMIGYNSEDLGGLGGEPVERFCAVRDSLGSAPVYQYFFKRNLPGDDDDPSNDPGAFHSAELWYVFGTLAKSWRPFTEADYALSERMLDAWTSFCKTGDPGWKAWTAAEPFRQEFDTE